jgi:hypothetical protein
MIWAGFTVGELLVAKYEPAAFKLALKPATGKLLRTLTCDGLLEQPMAVAVMPTNEVVVVDRQKAHLLVFPQDQDAPLVVGAGQLVTPTGLAIASDGRMCVVGGDYHVSVFSAEGQLQHRFPFKESSDGLNDIVRAFFMFGSPNSKVAFVCK